MTGKAIRMLPKLVTAPKKYIGMDGVHSYAQVRGVPHPHACAFVPDREQTIAVAGMDEYGNGCLLVAEFGSKSLLAVAAVVELVVAATTVELEKAIIWMIRRLDALDIIASSSLNLHLVKSAAVVDVRKARIVKLQTMRW